MGCVDIPETQTKVPGNQKKVPGNQKKVPGNQRCPLGAAWKTMEMTVIFDNFHGESTCKSKI